MHRENGAALDLCEELGCQSLFVALPGGITWKRPIHIRIGVSYLTVEGSLWSSYEQR